MLREGQTHTVTVEGFSSEAHGVARIDGQAVFVKGALPGEQCRIFIEHIGHNTVWARMTERLTPSPDRMEPDCPYYAQCGGCQTRHMSYPAELAFKAGKVQNALRRIGGIDPGPVPIHGCAQPERYRNKVQFPAQPSAALPPYGCGVPLAGAVAPGPRIGYFQARTHTVIDVDDCLLTPACAAPIRAAVKTWMETYAVPAYDEHSHTGLVRHLYLRTNAQGQALVCIIANSPSLPHEPEFVSSLRQAFPGLIGISLGVNTRRTNVILGESYRTLWGQDYLMDTLCGLQFKLSVPSFFQVNRSQAEVLYGLAGNFAALTGRETVLDLYCGTGTIGLTLASRAKAVIGVEVVPQAVADAVENARRNGITNARFLCADAAQAAVELEQEGVRPDVVVVDPPRKGMSPDTVEVLRRMSPRRIVYVSCDCATLARDLKVLCQDYSLQRVEAVDMFPRTHHVETVALLEKAALSKDLKQGGEKNHDEEKGV